MKSVFRKWVVLLSVTFMAVGLTAWSQPPEGGPRSRNSQEGPPAKGKQQGGPQSKFKVGTVIPPHVREELDLTPDQAKQIIDLEADVKQKLEKILTKEQLEMFGRPPFMGGPGGPGRGFEGRGPGGPGRGFEGRGPGGPGRGFEGRGPGGPPPGEGGDFPPPAKKKGGFQKKGGPQPKRPSPPPEDQ
jgi:hypothetical protein